MARQGRNPQELTERMVPTVQEHRGAYASGWQAMKSIARKFGTHPVMLHERVKWAEIDADQRASYGTCERERLKRLQRENREVRRDNEILKSASVFFATELDGRRPS